ncbi:MAG: hypothetical protein PF495_05400 [Spirochaetales bacterium]|jgi:hypothetical protein|nr:hypothetical protein [Spirochaetales bacterium]
MVLSPEDWITAQNIAAATKATFSITEAKDWPMFLSMMKIVMWVVSGILFLAGVMWWDLRRNIAGRRKEDTEKCNNCKTGIWDYIRGPMLNAILSCCYLDDATKIKLLADVKSYAEGAESHE